MVCSPRHPYWLLSRARLSASYVALSSCHPPSLKDKESGTALAKTRRRDVEEKQGKNRESRKRKASLELNRDRQVDSPSIPRHRESVITNRPYFAAVTYPEPGYLALTCRRMSSLQLQLAFVHSARHLVAQDRPHFRLSIPDREVSLGCVVVHDAMHALHSLPPIRAIQWHPLRCVALSSGVERGCFYAAIVYTSSPLFIATCI